MDHRRRSAVAAAPCSFGVFSSEDLGPDPDRFCRMIAEAGYDGTDLGPLGYLGRGSALRDRLERAGLRLAGGYVEIEVRGDDLRELDGVLTAFTAAATAGDLPPPRPTLAVDGPVAARVGQPGELSDGGWKHLAERVDAAAARCRDRGFEPVFHHHVGTWVETPEQIDRLLALTDVALCLDTGHLVLGGGDVSDAARWADRIGHLHLKDVRLARAERLRETGAPLEAIWEQDVFCTLGAGDVDVDAVLETVDPTPWVVVEQDRVIRDEDAVDVVANEAAAAQTANRAYLEERGW